MNSAVRGDRIKERRKSLKMSQQDLAASFCAPVSHTSICKWEQGAMQMSSSSLLELSTILECSVEYLTAESNDIESDLNKVSAYALPPVPLIAWKYITKGANDIYKLKPCFISDWLSCPIKHGSQTYAVNVLDDAMTQSASEKQNFSKGSILYVDPRLNPVNNSYVIAKIPGKETPIFKQYVMDGTNLYLFSHHKDYDPISITNKQFKIYGVVIGSFYAT